MMGEVKYAFELDDVVMVKALGHKGIVQMLGCDRGGILYHVKMAGESSWFYEDQLELSKGKEE